MKVTIFETNDEGDQHYATFENQKWGKATVFGWVTETGIIIFSREKPKFCPMTGKPLEASP